MKSGREFQDPALTSSIIFINGVQSPSINRDRDRGDRESVGYRLGHCTFAYREESIMGAQKKPYSGLLENLNS